MSLDYFNPPSRHLSLLTGNLGVRCSKISSDSVTLDLMHLIQRSVFWIGLSVVVIRCVYQVFVHQATFKDFVALLAYWAQLQQPLNVLGDSYRGIHSTLIDAEHLLELLNREPSIKDHPDSVELEVTRGEIKFEKVDFSYSQTAVLKQLAFYTPPGRMVAVVGETGGGKTTILKLMLRFREATRGNIFIDGKNICKIKLSSLWKHISIVQQVCASLISLMAGLPLFNRSVMFNIRVAKPDATDDGHSRYRGR
jgi:ATP-binding cassette, subfamily B, vacuolar membrane transporter HMT1/ACLQ